MIRCSICPKEAQYTENRNGPLCKSCWLGLKMFDFNLDRLGRARKYQLNELKSQKVARKQFREKRAKYVQSEDYRFAHMVREEKPTVPEVVKSRLVKVIKRKDR